MKLPTTATLAQVPGLLPALREAAAQPAQRGNALELDASALREFDTSLLSLLLQARREATAAGRGFAITSAPPKLVQLAALYGVSELLSLPPPASSPSAPSPAVAGPAGA